MVTLNTLNTLIDDMLLIIRNSNIVESENINRLQLKQWITTYRALLIKQDVDKDGDINPEYIQTLDDIYLEVVPLSNESGICKMRSLRKLPRTLDLNNRYGIVSITDNNGNTIQFGDKSKATKQKYRRFTCNDYIAYHDNGYLGIIGPSLINKVVIDGIWEDPDKVSEFKGDCSNDDYPYPIPYDKIPALKDLILSKELGVTIQMPSDIINNSKNDLLNNVREK